MRFLLFLLAEGGHRILAVRNCNELKLSLKSSDPNHSQHHPQYFQSERGLAVRCFSVSLLWEGHVHLFWLVYWLQWQCYVAASLRWWTPNNSRAKVTPFESKGSIKCSNPRFAMLKWHQGSGCCTIDCSKSLCVEVIRGTRHIRNGMHPPAEVEIYQKSDPAFTKLWRTHLVIVDLLRGRARPLRGKVPLRGGLRVTLRSPLSLPPPWWGTLGFMRRGGVFVPLLQLNMTCSTFSMSFGHGIYVFVTGTTKQKMP